MDEVTELRTECSKTYLNEDGSFTCRLMPRPVHELKSGLLVPYDFTVKDESNFEFNKIATAENFNFYSGDNTRPNRHLVCLDKGGNEWLNVKAITTEAVADPTVSAISGYYTQSKVLYSDVWPNVDVEHSVHSCGIKTNIILKSSPNSNILEFSLKGDDTFLKFHSPFIVGYEMDDLVSMQFGQIEIDGIVYKTIKYTVDPTFLQDAVYPVTIDPTLSFSATTDLEDANGVHSFSTSLFDDRNYGGLVTAGTGNWHNSTYNSMRDHSWWRVKDAALGTIPAGVFITGGRLKFHSLVNAWLPDNAFDISTYKILTANDWVEGTAGGAAETGSCDWNHAKHASQPWAGSAGCSTPGTDYDATPGGTITIPTTGAPITHVINISPAWIDAWIADNADNEGFMLKATTDETAPGPGNDLWKRVVFYTSEFAGVGEENPVIEIDYTFPAKKFISKFNRLGGFGNLPDIT